KSSFTKIVVAGDSASAVLTIDLVNGNPVPSGGFNFAGGGGTLKVEAYNASGTSDVSSVTAGGFSLRGNPVAYANAQSLVFDVVAGTFAPTGDLGPTGGAGVTVNDSAAVSF